MLVLGITIMPPEVRGYFNYVRAVINNLKLLCNPELFFICLKSTTNQKLLKS